VITGTDCGGSESSGISRLDQSKSKQGKVVQKAKADKKEGLKWERKARQCQKIGLTVAPAAA
jgi:hypothetical protein